MHPIVALIDKSQTIVLSTHTQPDGDGLGSQVALYYALKKVGKKVRIVNVDEASKKYDFLNQNHIIENFENLKTPIVKSDLCLIFDTNDPELIAPLWDELTAKCKKVAFVDHHPILDRHPLSTGDHLIDVEASSTGQITFDIIKNLQIPLKNRQFSHRPIF